MRIVLCGGGTMGHVTPALAIFDLIKKEYPSSEFLYVGRYGGSENLAVTEAGIGLKTVEIQGLKRKASFENLWLIKKIVKATEECKRIISEFDPDLIICTGGYVSYPMLKAAVTLGRKTVLHESNSVPGLVTKLFKDRVDLLLLASKELYEKLGKKSHFATVGTPIRQSEKISKAEARKRLGIRANAKYIVSFGGSLGADTVNRVCIRLMNEYEIKRNDIIHLHGTGRTQYDKLIKENPKLKSGRLKIVPFIKDVPLHLAACDLAITRSGALTIEEIKRTAAPSILIPSPNVTADHQRKNAMELVKSGGAVMLEEKVVSSESGLDLITEIINDEEALTKMKKSLSSYCGKENDRKLTNELKKLIKRDSASV